MLSLRNGFEWARRCWAHEKIKIIEAGQVHEALITNLTNELNELGQSKWKIKYDSLRRKISKVRDDLRHAELE